MAIPDEDVAQVRAATDIVALIGEHAALKRVGRRWTGLCPFHTEKSPSFSVNAEEGFYYCFGCQASGDAITFVRNMEHLDFVEAVRLLADRAGVTLHEDADGGRDRKRRTELLDALERAVEWYHQRLLTSPDAGPARDYLRSRGYDGAIVRQFRLGWAPDDWDALSKALRLPDKVLTDSGLGFVNRRGRAQDAFRARVLFPICDPSGRPVALGGRILPARPGQPPPDRPEPKYKNSQESAVYAKRRTLYALNWAKADIIAQGEVVVCEGYTDVIGFFQAGVPRAVATCGTALAEEHFTLLRNFGRRIVLAYDADAAGQAAAERYYEWERRFEVDIRVAALPAGSDPADLAQRDPAALAQAVADAQPYLGFRLDRLFGRADLSSPEGRVRSAADAMAMVAEHPNELVRDQYLMQVADRCRVDPSRLRQIAAAPRPRSGGTRSPTATDESAVGATEAPARVTVGGPELEALRLAVHHPELVADRLELVLFAHPLARACFEALSAVTTLHGAIEVADPQAADLIQRLAVEDTDADADDVMIRLVERAGNRALASLQAEMRQSDSADQAGFVPTVSWLKLTLETTRAEDIGAQLAALEAERRLVGWLVARDEAERQTEATSPDGGDEIDE